jgi:hypothetical protein
MDRKMITAIPQYTEDLLEEVVVVVVVEVLVLGVVYIVA